MAPPLLVQAQALLAALDPDALRRLLAQAEADLERAGPALALLEQAAADGRLEAALDAGGRAPEAVDHLAAVPSGLSRVETSLLAELQSVSGPLLVLQQEVAGLLAQAAPLLETALLLRQRGAELAAGPAQDEAVLFLQRLPKVLAQTDRMVTWASTVTGGADARSIPRLLETVDTELLPILKKLDGTQDDVLALRDAVERLVHALDVAGERFASLPGAGLLRRRGAE